MNGTPAYEESVPTPATHAPEEAGSKFFRILSELDNLASQAETEVGREIGRLVGELRTLSPWISLSESAREDLKARFAQVSSQMDTLTALEGRISDLERRVDTATGQLSPE